MTAMIQPLILCGGAGTRLWPESRGARAKQFLTLTDGESLFRQTVARVPAGPHFLPPVILCGDAHV
ncbi:MAG: mannose-1-phosphate guanylyltransferase, partial [Alphaproteobacteria bacterium HGW-Alphaproteobacteria-13]